MNVQARRRREQAEWDLKQNRVWRERAGLVLYLVQLPGSKDQRALARLIVAAFRGELPGLKPMALVGGRKWSVVCCSLLTTNNAHIHMEHMHTGGATRRRRKK